MKSWVSRFQKQDKALRYKLLAMFLISGLLHVGLVVGVAIAGNGMPEPSIRDRSLKVKMFSPPARKKVRQKPRGRPKGSQTAPPRVVPKPKPVKKPAPKPVTPAAKPKPAKLKSGTDKPAQAKPVPVKPAAKEKVIPKDATSTDVVKSRGERGPDNATQLAMSSRLKELRGRVDSRNKSASEVQWDSALGHIRGNAQAWSYHDQVSEFYSQAMSTPPSVPRDRDLVIKAIVRVDQNGTVLDYKLLEVSSDKTFNYIVINTLRSIKSLGPVPFSVDPAGLRLPLLFEP